MSQQSSNDKPTRRSRLWGILATVAFHLVVLLGLIWAMMTAEPVGADPDGWPPVRDQELLYGGEYVVIGDAAPSVEAPQPVEATADLAEAPITQEHESPVKVQKPEKPAPSEAEIREQQRLQREQETSRRIADRVTFGNGSSQSTRNGQTNGNADHGALSGAPGTDLAGRTLASWTKPAATATGSITVEVRVDRRGRVTSARYVRGTGSVAGNKAARRSCEQAALHSAFSVSDDAPASQRGTITYHFE